MEIIAGKHGALADETVATVLRRLYDLGIRPDWWKLEPQATRTAWQHIGDEIRARDPFCRGVVLLGLEASEDALDQAFQTAASDPIVKGFAVGRTIFAEPADAWLRGQLDDAGAIAEMAQALLAPDRRLEKSQARQLGGGLREIHVRANLTLSSHASKSPPPRRGRVRVRVGATAAQLELTFRSIEQPPPRPSPSLGEGVIVLGKRKRKDWEPLS